MSEKTKQILIFILKTLFYVAVILALLYFYNYQQSAGSGFVYNEF